MAAKYAGEKKLLADNALNCYLIKRMNYEQLCRAMELALRHANQALGCSHPVLLGVDVQCSTEVFRHARPLLPFHVCQRFSESHRLRPPGAQWRALVNAHAGNLA